MKGIEAKRDLIGVITAAAILAIAFASIAILRHAGPDYQVGDTFRYPYPGQAIAIRIVAIEAVDGDDIARYEILCPHYVPVPEGYEHNWLTSADLETEWVRMQGEVKPCK